MHSPLLAYLAASGVLPDPEHPHVPRLLELVQLRRVEKGDFLLREGEVCRFIAFVEKGLLLYCRDTDGEETAVDFTTENQWVTQIQSFYEQVPSGVGIRALETCTLHALSREAMPQVFALFPEMVQVRITETERSFMRLANHQAAMLQLDARQRYQKLVQERPDLIQRVPQYLIASYLGIQPQSLSRIRAEMKA